MHARVYSAHRQLSKTAVKTSNVVIPCTEGLLALVGRTITICELVLTLCCVVASGGVSVVGSVMTVAVVTGRLTSMGKPVHARGIDSDWYCPSGKLLCILQRRDKASANHCLVGWESENFHHSLYNRLAKNVPS